MYLFVTIVTVLLDPQDLLVAGSSMFTLATFHPGEPDPSNENLDRNDHSPGSLVQPKHYRRYSAPLLRTRPIERKCRPKRPQPWFPRPTQDYKRYSAPLPKIEPWDLTDDQINVHDYHYRNNSEYFLWENSPCKKYREKLESARNDERDIGCYDVSKRLRKDQRKEARKTQPSSKNCSGVIGYSTCFEFRGHKSRCYMMIRYGSG